MSEPSGTPPPLASRLPGLDCGSCGFRSCEQFSKLLAENPDEARRCTHLSDSAVRAPAPSGAGPSAVVAAPAGEWKDMLGRAYDFLLDCFPGAPGPREIILPHNPVLTRELDIRAGDVILGRPMGMSCGCPITHCGTVAEADPKTGVIAWDVTGPLKARSQGFKDLGYYTALAYEGIVKDTACELRIGMRYWFLPRHCMLQWRHSGLVNFLSKSSAGLQVRIEGLMIG